MVLSSKVHCCISYLNFRFLGSSPILVEGLFFSKYDKTEGFNGLMVRGFEGVNPFGIDSMVLFKVQRERFGFLFFGRR